VLALTEQGYEAVEAIDLGAFAAAAPKAPAAAEEARSGATGEASVRLAALRLVHGLRTAVGVGKVAEAITGSRAEWVQRLGADQLEAYGAVSVKRAHAENVVRAMIGEGLLAQDLGTGYPTLHLTDAGEIELVRLEQAAPPTAAGAQETPETARPVSDALAAALDELLGELLGCDPERAKALVERLRVYHPRELVARLASRYHAAGEVRQRSRAVWAVGELGGHYGLAFLVQCARSDQDNVRRLAASALGKVLPAAAHAAASLAEELHQAEEALAALKGDPAPQVRQYAEKALSVFLRHGGK